MSDFALVVVRDGLNLDVTSKDGQTVYVPLGGSDGDPVGANARVEVEVNTRPAGDAEDGATVLQAVSVHAVTFVFAAEELAAALAQATVDVEDACRDALGL